MLNTDFFQLKKNENFVGKKIIFSITLFKTLIVPLRRGGSSEYPQSMFWNKNKKKRYIPVNPQFYMHYTKVRFKGVYISWSCFYDVCGSFYEGGSKSPRKSAAKLLVFMGNSRSVCMLYINILLTYAQNLNKIG